MKLNQLNLVVLVIMAFSLSVFAASETKDSPLTKVEPIKVCMVNNKVFEKDQIPVEVEGKTYYGCCEMCKKTLAEKREFRVSIDPVSGKEVDKAKAVIGADKDGKTVYFENEENFKKFNSKADQK